MVTNDGRLAQLWDTDRWNVYFLAEIVEVLAAFLRAHATLPIETATPVGSRRNVTPVIPVPSDITAAAKSASPGMDSLIALAL